MKLFKLLTTGLIAICLIIFLSFLFIQHHFSPDFSGSVSLPQLHDTSEVYFDEFGVPHIYAQNDQDAFHSLGYIHASQRLFQMDLLRRVGGGKLSEFFGEKLIETDKFFRTLGINESALLSADVFKKSKSKSLTLTKSYLEGINSFIRNGKKPVEYYLLGLDPEEFTIADCFRTTGYMGFSFGQALKTDPLLDWIQHNLSPKHILSLKTHCDSTNFLIPSMNDSDLYEPIAYLDNIQNLLATLPVGKFENSNAWVVSPSRTKSGKVHFANDTHIGYSQPAIWWEAHISTPTINLFGNFLAGFPFPLVGHTNKHTWGLTIFPNDDMDFYREKVRGKKVQSRGVWTPLTVREEKVNIKGKTAITFPVYETSHGPIISQFLSTKESEKDSISVFWTFTKFPLRLIEAAYDMSFCNKIEGFTQGVSKIHAPGLNIMYGDNKGNIAWLTSGKLLNRPSHVNNKLILNGWNGKDDPIGFLPFTQNPKSINPKEGYVYSANNQPTSPSPNGTLPKGYYYPGKRAHEIIKALKQNESWSIEDSKALQLKNTSSFYPKYAKRILSFVEPKTAWETVLFNLLKDWDGEHELESIGPTIYYNLYYKLAKQTFADELPENLFNIYMETVLAKKSFEVLIEDQHNIWWDDINTPQKEDFALQARKAFQKTALFLAEFSQQDIEKLKWKYIHLANHEHPIGKQKPLNKLFNVEGVAIEGGEEVLNKTAFAFAETGYFPAKSGPALRTILDFQNSAQALNILPTGQSGNPFSPHYDDQVELYQNGQYRIQYLSKKEILEHVQEPLYLIPFASKAN